MKKRKPVAGNLYSLLYEYAISSFDFFVAAYSDTGVSVMSSSLNGTLAFSP